MKRQRVVVRSEYLYRASAIATGNLTTPNPFPMSGKGNRTRRKIGTGILRFALE